LRGIVAYNKNLAFQSTPVINDQDSIPTSTLRVQKLEQKPSKDISVDKVDIRLKDISLKADSLVVIEEGIMVNREKKTVRASGVVQFPAKDAIVLTSSDSEPLIVIDGKIIPQSPDLKERMSTLNRLDPRIIKTINVLKGQSAIDKYKELGKNGVIEFILRKPQASPGNGLDKNRNDTLTAELTVMN
jgi:hypothetical protein